MKKPSKPLTILDHYPEETREAADLLKQAVPLMVGHAIPPNPVHYALWYTYCRGQDSELNRRMDKVLTDFDVFPSETAAKLFREFIIHGELEDARLGQQQVIDLVDDIEGNLTTNLSGSEAYKDSLSQGLAALQEPIADDLPNVLHDLQQSTQLMHEQQEKFLYRLRSAQSEINSLRQQLDRAHLAATLDSLTQIFNRSSFTRLLDQALQKGHERLALVMLDIDHFKQFNDQYGHPLGDRVLQHVGQLLREFLPAKAVAARYGGEEFCVILQDCPNLDSAHQFAELIRQKLQALRVKVRRTDKVLDSITASFGLAMAEAGDDIEDLITRADDALYEAKRSGRNQIQPARNPALSA